MTVQYNHLNLPKKMTFGNDYIEITYDAAGTKLRKVAGNNAILTGGGGTEKSMNGKEGEKGKDDNATETAASAGPPTNYYTHDYLGGIEYRDGVREAIYTAEGRLFNNAGTNRYEYTIKDHLGNARISFTDKNGNNTIEYSNGEVLQENHYYPFGLAYEGPWVNDAARDNRYQYNGKEINDDFGLNWYNYGKRWYDAAIGRFPTVDPIASDFTFVTPYNYAENEPVANIDLWGLQQKSIINGDLIGGYKINKSTQFLFNQVNGVPYSNSSTVSIVFDQWYHDNITGYTGNAAITLGNNIIFADGAKIANSRSYLELMSHEIIHNVQYSRKGDRYLIDYGLSALKAASKNGSFDSNIIHDDISMESEANIFENQFGSFLSFFDERDGKGMPTGSNMVMNILDNAALSENEKISGLTPLVNMWRATFVGQISNGEGSTKVVTNTPISPLKVDTGNE